MLYEFCAENFTRVPDAIAHGAVRVELCDNLAQGGTSPSMGVLDHTLAYAHAHGAAIMTMVRSRGGDFVYSEDELAIMAEDASVAAERGADGIVLGCLRGESGCYRVDEAATERVILAAQRAAGTRTLEVTFHMAFDELDGALQADALPRLASLGVTRVLTHGGRAGTPILDNAPRIRRLVEAAPDGLQILPGGGITWRNRDAVTTATSASELHGTRVVPLRDGLSA